MRILLVDDHKMMRDGLRAILEKEEGVEIVGEASNGHEAIVLALRHKPEVVVMDISMPDLNGVDATRRLVTELGRVKVIGLSMNADRRYVVAMFEAGASGYLLKNSASDELIQAVRAVASDLTYVSPAIASVVVGGFIAPSVRSERKSDRPLSPREREVLQLLAEGKSSKDIALRLSLAVATVETHRRQMMDKLSLRTIAELTKYAIREGLTSID
jgi:two-component system, NarL family, response regulator NreC